MDGRLGNRPRTRENEYTNSDTADQNDETLLSFIRVNIRGWLAVTI